jgi:hypothetical protein
LVINEQLSYIFKKKLGFDKDRVLVLEDVNTLGDKIDVLKNELLQLSSVQNVTVTSYSPIEGANEDEVSCWTKLFDQRDFGRPCDGYQQSNGKRIEIG